MRGIALGRSIADVLGPNPVPATAPLIHPAFPGTTILSIDVRRDQVEVTTWGYRHFVQANYWNVSVRALFNPSFDYHVPTLGLNVVLDGIKYQGTIQQHSFDLEANVGEPFTVTLRGVSSDLLVGPA